MLTPPPDSWIERQPPEPDPDGPTCACGETAEWRGDRHGLRVFCCEDCWNALPEEVRE